MYVWMRVCVRNGQEEYSELQLSDPKRIRHSACEYNGMLSGHLKFKCCVLNAL